MPDPLHNATVTQAVERLTELVTPTPTVRLPLDQARNLVLAEPILTDRDVPPFTKAMMDGFAIRSADFDPANASRPITLNITGQVAAGQNPDTTLQPGQAFSINTGAPMPNRADAVVPIEWCDPPIDQRVRINPKRPVRPGLNVQPQAHIIAAGNQALPAGTPLNPAAIAVAATCGTTHVLVHRRPKIAVIVTGSELVPAEQTPGPAQIREGNNPMLRALIENAHAEPLDLGITPDDPDATVAAVRAGLQADALCISGGVSMGRFDFVPDALDRAGVRIVVRKTRLKPGKPTTLGIGPDGQPVLALVGNPIGCYVGFVLFAIPTFDRLKGLKRSVPPIALARLGADCTASPDRETYLPARLDPHPVAGQTATPLLWHGSSDAFNFARADALIRLPAGSGRHERDAQVEVRRI